MIGQPVHIINDKLLCLTWFLLLIGDCSVMLESGKLYNKCHHNIIYGSLNLNIFLPPPYYKKVWDYKNRSCMHTACNFISKLE